MSAKDLAMVELTQEQQRALKGELPPRVRDPETNEIYVLVRSETYERFRRMLGDDDGLDMRQVGVLIGEAMRDDDADDPLLASYQNYRRPQ
jgi:hypothetical protein